MVWTALFLFLIVYYPKRSARIDIYCFLVQELGTSVERVSLDAKAIAH